MARPLRIEYAGACYHVMNRGNQRARVFHADEHYELFANKLGESAPVFDVRIMAWCLMPNHFHLYLTTEKPNLSRFMQSLLTSFTVSINRRRRTCGHVFQGRFRAHLVEDESYGTELTRYIHLNPVRVARLRGASLKERRQALRTYRWSSFASLVGLRLGPAWLDADAALAGWAGRRAARMTAYRGFVEQGLVRDVPNPLEHLQAQTILGSEPFVDRIKRQFLLVRSADRREQPALVRLQRSFSVEELAGIVASVCGVAPQDVCRRRSPHRLGRRLLMYVACRHGRRDRSLSGLAAALGVSVSGLTMARDRFAQSLPRDRQARRLLAAVEARLHDEAHDT